MNERIKELAEQATSIVESPPNREGWTSSYAYFDKEKFAELIVRECAAEAHRRVCIEGNDNMIYARLLEHFGVEE
jgi:hypothetical protein